VPNSVQTKISYVVRQMFQASGWPYFAMVQTKISYVVRQMFQASGW